MCGVAALLTFDSQPLHAPQLRLMTDTAAHRGPDAEGFSFWGTIDSLKQIETKKIVASTVKNLNAGRLTAVGLGHRRLAIVDLSPAGQQPLRSANGRYWITYNGEIYNYVELQAELRAKGYVFQTQTDTEVILAAFAEWGAACVSRFNGMWAFVLYDAVEQILFASRDRFGVKPLYYSRTDSAFAFASEIKQLTVAGFGTGRAERAKVAQFLVYGDVNSGSTTCFEGVWQLKPGHSLLWDLRQGPDAEKISAYYVLPDTRSEKKLPYGYYLEEFRKLLHDAVRLRLRSDVEVGSCLSGGMDSSSLVLLMRELLPKRSDKLQTFTSCFTDKTFDEWEFAQKTVDRSQAHAHQVFPEMANIWSELPEILWHQDEPFGSTSIYAQWNVMRMAHQKGIKVLLDGQGADEVMFGYHSYLPLHLSTLLRRRKITQALKSLGSLHKSGILDASGGLPRSLLKTAAALLGFRSVRTPELQSLLRPEHEAKRQLDQPVDLEEVRRHEMQESLQALLRYEDRNSMAFSIEARTPFLDYRLVEFYLKIPMEYHYHDGWTKPLLRSSMLGSMPDEVRLRADKKGFVTPENLWLEENQAQIQNELRSENSALGIWLNPESDKEKMSPGATWRMLCTHLWMKRFELK